MSKNLIYMVAIDHNTSQFKNTDYSQYAKSSWSAWCSKNNIDFKIIDTHNPMYKFPVWNKDLIFDIVGDQYDKIGYVDSDTMVKWDAPNPFDLYDDEFCGVIDRSSLRWILNSIKAYSPFYPEINLDLDNYINSGITFFTKEHKFIFDNLKQLYLQHSSGLDEIKGVGKVQTVLNYELIKNNVKVKYLDPRWNLFSIHKKNMFQHNWQLKQDTIPFFIKYSYIWHFTGFPIENRTDIMKQTWELTKHLYE
jgi:hypothetical protein